MKATNPHSDETFSIDRAGALATVKVLAIREAWSASCRTRPVIDVVDERTGRRLTFRSAARLRRPAHKEVRT